MNLKPIGQKRKASKGRIGLVLNDDRDSWYEAYSLFPGNIAYVWHANTHQPVIMDDLKKCNFEITSVIIWNKNLHSIGFSDYQWKHEACIYATRGNHNWKGGRNQFTVWDIPNIICLTKDEGEWGHSTQKPIECMKRPIVTRPKGQTESVSVLNSIRITAMRLYDAGNRKQAKRPRCQATVQVLMI